MKSIFNIKIICLHIGMTSILTLMSISASAFAQDKVIEALNTVVKTHDNSARSQQRINELDEKSANLLHEYRHTIRQSQNLEVYNQQLKKLVDSQLAELSSLQQQLKDIEVTQQEITPLMLSMLKTLEDFISRVDIAQEQLDILVRIGALRFTGLNKYELMWEKNAVYQPHTHEAASGPAFFDIDQEEYELPVLLYV